MVGGEEILALRPCPQVDRSVVTGNGEVAFRLVESQRDGKSVQGGQSESVWPLPD